MGTLNLSQYREVLENCASATEVVSPEVSHALPIGHRFSGSVGSSNVNLDIAETSMSAHLFPITWNAGASLARSRSRYGALSRISEKTTRLIPGMITLLAENVGLRVKTLRSGGLGSLKKCSL